MEHLSELGLHYCSLIGQKKRFYKTWKEEEEKIYTWKEWKNLLFLCPLFFFLQSFTEKRQRVVKEYTTL